MRDAYLGNKVPLPVPPHMEVLYTVRDALIWVLLSAGHWSCVPWSCCIGECHDQRALSAGWQDCAHAHLSLRDATPTSHLACAGQPFAYNASFGIHNGVHAQATGFSNSEEDAIGRSALVPFLLEDRIKEVSCSSIPCICQQHLYQCMACVTASAMSKAMQQVPILPEPSNLHPER